MTLMWLILATTEVQFITSGIGLRVASACLWQKLYHFTSHKVADAFGHENAFSAWGDRVSSYRDCMHVWKTWMAFDEVTPVSTMLFSISTRSRYYIAVQLHLLECFVIHYTSSACWGSEWAEKGSACGWHVLHLLKASNNRAYKESCLPIKSRTLFIPAPNLPPLMC